MARADSSNDFRTLKHHDEYYLTGGDLYFLVEQYLFRVHKYFFERESLYFKQELGTPASPGETRRGSSEGNAIILKDVTHREFAKFLWVFYNPRYSIYAADWEDWTDILKLAQRWSFSEVKDLAIRELENLDMPDVERVHFYQEYAVDRRLLIARYAALTERADPLTFDEGIRLGIATSLMIARARECVRSPVQAGIRSPISPSVDADEMNVIIKDLFNISDGPAYTPIEQFRPSPFVKASGGLVPTILLQVWCSVLT
ncbi:hypothetical protein CYLTODRAFT_345745 [Cylindrobasidium torrendii FP15055 ss-10]|uniref:BTB domain-containing protein n=1 Tax=Cylindrobasidium torrendii FP15055 ss-10 TaxID=1314674 RepID=A0A0D7BMZ1_9AGAR|nr:hypothetical protein CYLTODRAFT_345745 [Cylindrobasidium torrendii FP15055 ss-10]